MKVQLSRATAQGSTVVAILVSLRRDRDSAQAIAAANGLIQQASQLKPGICSDNLKAVERVYPSVPVIYFAPNLSSVILTSRPRVCIVGGGFGGLYTALRLESLVWPDDKKPQVSFGFKVSLASSICDDLFEFDVDALHLPMNQDFLKLDVAASGKICGHSFLQIHKSWGNES
ncbi:hypothetical protein HAX54_000565 [Datura stramonium]|uniref:Uncharacterized protein n=1 Tax=Datura stramonium TaxID=4076 RepID=A0ABS8WQ24_DATST|nr:hypothetical protein [Datura stramonium]